MLYLQSSEILLWTIYTHWLTVVEMHKLPDIEKIDSKNEFLRLNLTKHFSRQKVGKNYQTETNKLKIFVYRYRNNIYLKGSELELIITDYEKLFSKRVHLLSYLDVFFKRCIVLDETTAHE